jgi:hypothetical protein
MHAPMPPTAMCRGRLPLVLSFRASRPAACAGMLHSGLKEAGAHRKRTPSGQVPALLKVLPSKLVLGSLEEESGQRKAGRGKRAERENGAGALRSSHLKRHHGTKGGTYAGRLDVGCGRRDARRPRGGEGQWRKGAQSGAHGNRVGALLVVDRGVLEAGRAASGLHTRHSSHTHTQQAHALGRHGGRDHCSLGGVPEARAGPHASSARAQVRCRRAARSRRSCVAQKGVYCNWRVQPEGDTSTGGVGGWGGGASERGLEGTEATRTWVGARHWFGEGVQSLGGHRCRAQLEGGKRGRHTARSNAQRRRTTT